MLRGLKSLLVVSVVAAAIVALFPVSSGASVAMAPCQAKDVFKLEEWSHTALVTGQYTLAGAVDVQLTCGIVQNGVTVRRVTDSAPGPVAALAATVNIQGQYYSVCHEIYATLVDGTYTSDTCP